MHRLELPHTHDCLVCGRDNPHGLKLSLHVEPESGLVTTKLVPQPHHIGFEGIIHGGVLATVLDEAMVWAATWKCRCFCVAAEMTVRFKNSARVGETLVVRAEVMNNRKIITTIGSITRDDGTVVAEAGGKYMQMSKARHEAMIRTFVEEPGTERATQHLT